MSGVETIGLACWVAISIAFGVCRWNALFSTASIAAIGGFVFYCATTDGSDLVSCAVTTVGLTAYWIGLLFVRSMISRSISLDMLLARAAGDTADFDALVAARLDETVKYKLASFDGRRFQLTAFGRVMAVCLGVAYRATGLAE
jgi:hypothetical protein